MHSHIKGEIKDKCLSYFEKPLEEIYYIRVKHEGVKYIVADNTVVNS